MKQENIAIYLPVLQRFWQRVFQTLPNLDVHPGVAVYHTLKIFSIVNAKDLLMPHTKFQVCTLKINTIFCHRKKKSHYFWTGVYNILIKQIVFEIIGWGRGVGCVPPLNLPLDTNWWVTYGRERDRQLKQENQLYAKSFTSNYVILNYRANNALINALFCELPTTTDQD